MTQDFWWRVKEKSFQSRAKTGIFGIDKSIVAKREEQLNMNDLRFQSQKILTP